MGIQIVWRGVAHKTNIGELISSPISSYHIIISTTLSKHLHNMKTISFQKCY